MGRKSNLDIIAAGGVIILMFFFIYRYGGGVNLNIDIGSKLFNLFPGLIIVIACMFITTRTRGVGTLGGTLGMGIGFCYLIERANNIGLVTVEMLSGLTIFQIQIWTMIIATIIGAIIYTQ